MVVQVHPGYRRQARQIVPKQLISDLPTETAVRDFRQARRWFRSPISLAAGVAILVISGFWLLKSPATSKPTDGIPKPTLVDSEAQAKPDPNGAAQLRLKGRPFEVDPDRLYDSGYVNDPGVQALAKAYGIPPACLLAVARYSLYQVQPQPGVCPSPADATDVPTLAVGRDHPYNQYSDAQLRSLAISSPEAAVILARRLESDGEAKEMYERAAALSGIAHPLIEWMTLRDTGGLRLENGVLDVELAKEGYKMFLIAAAFDGAPRSITESYREELVKAGADLGPIEQAAEEEVAELRLLRHELTGGERP